MSRLGPALAAVAVLIASGTAKAQNAESDKDRAVQAAISAQKAQTDLTDKRCRLGASSANEIVVCAQDPEQFRYPGREGLESVQSTRDGALHAPDLAPHYPGVVVARGCFIPPCPPPKMIFIDVKALPEAPPGSDADKVAKGEMPER